jgi:hypothetical protein
MDGEFQGVKIEIDESMRERDSSPDIDLSEERDDAISINSVRLSLVQ